MVTEANCRTCTHAGHSDTGKIACAALNSIDTFGLPGDAAPDAMVEHIDSILPKAYALYRGWAHLGRRPGQKGDGTAGAGLMTANVFLLDPTAWCALHQPMNR